MNIRRLVVAAGIVAFLHCGGSSPTEPSSATTGRLEFFDSGCACGPTPYPGVPVYIDGQLAGTLPVFGKLVLTLPVGDHVWAVEVPGNGAHVYIRPGTTTTEHVVTNAGCPDPCTD